MKHKFAFFVLLLLLIVPSSVAAQPAPGENPPPVPGPPNHSGTMADFAVGVYQDTHDTWTRWFTYWEREDMYYAPYLIYAEPGTSAVSNCGGVTLGDPQENKEFSPAFYCPYGGDIGSGGTTTTPVIYISTSWLYYELADVNPDNFDFAVASLIAHEYGHHIEFLFGHTTLQGYTSEQVELPADCLSGIWANDAYTQGQLDETDVEEAAIAAWNHGTDFPLEPGTPGDHGTREERVDAFMWGYNNNSPRGCFEQNFGW